MNLRHKIESLLVTILPTFLYRILGGIYGFCISPKKSYSQYGEDLVIKNFFAVRNPNQGVYVDIGGFHPRWLSNTYLLAEDGWSGVAVDIDKHKTNLFEKVRSNCIGITAAVFPGNSQGEQSVHKFRRLWSEIDTLSLPDAQKYLKETGISFDTEVVKTTTINQVLAKATQSFGPVRFMNIDIEGLDEAILFEMDFETYPVDLICFENNESFAGSDKVKTILTEKGYVHLFTTRGTHGYAKRSLL